MLDVTFQCSHIIQLKEIGKCILPGVYHSHLLHVSCAVEAGSLMKDGAWSWVRVGLRTL